MCVIRVYVYVILMILRISSYPDEKNNIVIIYCKKWLIFTIINDIVI